MAVLSSGFGVIRFQFEQAFNETISESAAIIDKSGFFISHLLPVMEQLSGQLPCA
jgi:hypothetical protein